MRDTITLKVGDRVTSGCLNGGGYHHFFKLAVDELLETIERLEISRDLMEIIQRILRIVGSWCATTRQSDNSRKTEIAVITLNGSLQFSSASKYLGVSLEDKLSMKAHF